jgi:hypothetical protein
MALKGLNRICLALHPWPPVHLHHIDYPYKLSCTLYIHAAAAVVAMLICTRRHAWAVYIGLTHVLSLAAVFHRSAGRGQTLPLGASWIFGSLIWLIYTTATHPWQFVNIYCVYFKYFIQNLFFILTL